MADVRIAEHAGACFGVERALNMAHELAREAGGRAHTLGPLIHNPLVVRELADEGIGVVRDAGDVGVGDVLLLRTHGVAPEVARRARETGARVEDATCPFVKKVHRYVERLEAEGYQVLVVGEQGHPEVEGTLGHAKDAVVVGSGAELAGLRLSRKVGVVVQTTLARSVLREVVSELVGRCEELRVVDTICEATRERQQAAAELAATSDVMVVVGGRNSANTTHLHDICAAACMATHHVESADELEPAWFAGARSVGITAGASTPAAHIEAVRTRVEQLCLAQESAGRP